MMILSKLKQIIPRRRRTIVVIVVIGLVLLITAYILGSMSTWNSYKTTYETWQKDLHTSADLAIALPGKTAGERTKKIAAFRNVSNKINSAQRTLCSISPLVAWQRNIANLHQREEICNQIIGKADVFGKKMQATISYLQSEEGVATAISKALTNSDGKFTEATWSSQVPTWQAATTAITKVSAESSFAPVKASALEKIKGVEAAWAELIAAHMAKDKAKYIEAQGKLTASYEALASLPTMSTEKLIVLTTSLKKAYSQLF